MALSEIVSVYMPQAALESKFPGFKACFGGEELQRAQAAMTSSLVGGTIEALLATDMPPSLARLTSTSQPVARTFSLGTGKGHDADRQLNTISAPAGTHGQASSKSTGPQAAGAGPRGSQSGQQSQSATSELDALAELYHSRLEVLGILAPHTDASEHDEAEAAQESLPAQESTPAPATKQEDPHHDRQKDESDTEPDETKTATQVPQAQAEPETFAKEEVPEGAAVSPDDVATKSAGTEQTSAATTDAAAAEPAPTAATATATVAAEKSQPEPQSGQPRQQQQLPADIGLQMALGNVPVPAAAGAGAAELAASVPGYASACYESAYGLGLVLQDLSVRCEPGSEEHAGRLMEACQMYSVAVAHRPSAHMALYNWGVALSDLARVLKATDVEAATTCLEAACRRYSEALALHPATPQALNNWGLGLQELSSLAPGRKERDALLKQACSKFRQALRMRPEFDRGVYNLGTVCYAAASTMQSELAGSPKVKHSHSGSGQHHKQSNSLSAAEKTALEAQMRHLLAVAAQYILLAFALQQQKDIYRKSLGVLRKLLPLPFLRAGYLTTLIPNTDGTAQEAWRQDWFVLDAQSLRSATGAEGQLSVAAAAPSLPTNASPRTLLSPHVLTIPLQSIAHVERFRDPTLPKGEAFVVILQNAHIDLTQEVVLVAEDDDSADAWVDVLTLAAHCVRSRSTEALAEALMPSATSGTGAYYSHSAHGAAHRSR